MTEVSAVSAFQAPSQTLEFVARFSLVFDPFCDIHEQDQKDQMYNQG